jgi:HJR/Mrr/RecB family endonuclease
MKSKDKQIVELKALVEDFVLKSNDVLKIFNENSLNIEVELLETYLLTTKFALNKVVSPLPHQNDINSSEVKIKRFINEITLLSSRFNFEKKCVNDLRRTVLKIQRGLFLL